MQADADIWETLQNMTGKDNWAYAALLSIFGAESKLYRARTPRAKDAGLKVFPAPVILVLRRKKYSDFFLNSS